MGGPSEHLYGFIKMVKGEDIICISSNSWNFLPTRKQRFMNMFADDGNRVLYVDPVISFIPRMRNPEFYPDATTHLILNRVREGVTVLTPPLGLPFGRNPLIGRINQYLQYTCVAKCQMELGFETPILWVYEPRSAHFLKRVRRKLLVYDCVDEHGMYPGVNREEVERLEREILKTADIVFVTSESLLNSKRRYNENVFLVPNGVDVDAYSTSLKDGTEPADIRPIPRPRLGFVGGIHSWTDLDLVCHLARERPEWSVVLVGPVGHDADTSKVKDLANVHLVGYKSPDAVPSYISSFDVCLNLFKLSEMTEKVNPLKVYEYLAAGKPVVSVDLPEIRRLKDVVYVATSYPDFVSDVEEAISKDGPQRRSQRLKRAREYSWNGLFERLSAAVKTRLDQSTSNPRIVEPMTS